MVKVTQHRRRGERLEDRADRETLPGPISHGPACGRVEGEDPKAGAVLRFERPQSPGQPVIRRRGMDLRGCHPKHTQGSQPGTRASGQHVTAGETHVDKWHGNPRSDR
ncbi:hypothetical protein SSPO_003550 [Streptomyces antimycoticus]|uniref:Uncharacterized protein n=1 Tax=Streptomyces antimycoticus TaxID=68175 RepID=A0A499UUS5_9ACTN|nr:hypothetical protein SSPO_003550 [Streptomyces antimycoticus]